MKKNILLFASILMLTTACEKIVEIDIPSEDSRLVIESQITSKMEPWSVYLSLSQPYFDQDPANGVANASVTISGSDGSVENLSNIGGGLFQSDSSLEALVGITYTLTVDFDGVLYEASEEMPNANPIDLILSYNLPENNGFIEAGYYVFIKGVENPYEGDSYLFNFFVNDTLQDDFGFLLENDEFGPVSFLNPGIDPNDPLSGIPNILPRPFPFTVEPGDSILVEQRNLTPKYYNYLFDLQSQLNRSGSPFDPPPANLNTNISNGALGYFSVANFKNATMVVQP